MTMPVTGSPPAELWPQGPQQTADRAMDAVRERFGRDVIGYAAATLDGKRSVPDAFRELAERELGGQDD